VGLNLALLGPPDARPPVVLSHGLLVGNLATWYLTCGPALARTRRVVTWDLRGHGRSDRPPTGYDLPTMAGDLSTVLDAVSPEGPADLVGHSYGALVALRLALTSPGRVRSLALVEAPLSQGDVAALTGWASLPAEQLAAALPPALQADLDRGGRRARRLLQDLSALVTGTRVLADVAAFPGLSDDELRRLSCPVLAIYGTRSACRPEADRLRRVLPTATVVEVEGGHYLPLEATAAVGEVLEGWLHA
jgi:pimeloyl-ACP methyl ester carboxylesterase